MNPLVSLNILTSKGGRKFIKNCLDSIIRQKYSPIEVTIMDNNSRDGTVKIIEKKYPQFKLIKNNKNIGFAPGHNKLIKKSKGEFILCVNQDTILDEEIIEKSIKLFQKDQKIGAVQPKILRLKESENGFKKTDIIDTTGLLIFKNRRVINRGQGEKDTGQFNKTEEIFGADGALPFFRRTALEDTKIPKIRNNKIHEFFDEDFFAYKEDVDLAWRFKLMGWKTMYFSEAKGWHFRTGGKKNVFFPWQIIKESKKVSPFIKYLSFKNQRLTQIKNEIPLIFLKHLPWIITKELASLTLLLFFEKQPIKTLKDLFVQIPSAWKKRKVIMKKKIITNKEINKWFN